MLLKGFNEFSYDSCKGAVYCLCIMTKVCDLKYQGVRFIPDSHPVEQFQFSGVCLLRWFRFSFSSFSFLPSCFSFPSSSSGCCMLSCWAFGTVSGCSTDRLQKHEHGTQMNFKRKNCPCTWRAEVKPNCSGGDISPVRGHMRCKEAKGRHTVCV